MMSGSSFAWRAMAAARARESGISGKVRWNLGKGNLEFRERLDGISGKGIWNFGKG
jgi:hypothetical protein